MFSSPFSFAKCKLIKADLSFELISGVMVTKNSDSNEEKEKILNEESHKLAAMTDKLN